MTPIRSTLLTIGAIHNPTLLALFEALAVAKDDPAAMVALVSTYAVAAAPGQSVNAAMIAGLILNCGDAVSAVAAVGEVAIAQVVAGTVVEADLQAELDQLDTELAAALP